MILALDIPLLFIGWYQIILYQAAGEDNFSPSKAYTEGHIKRKLWMMSVPSFPECVNSR